MALFETWLTSDLKKPMKVEQLKGNLFSSDNGGNLIGVEVMDNGSPASLSGGVTGYMIRADGATLTMTGTLTNNKASIVLPASAYVVVGQASIVIKVGTTTVGACTAYVYRTTTDMLVDPGHVIPSIEELLAKIADCEAATAAAMKVANLTVSAETASGSTPTATLSEEGSGSSAHKHITFGLVPGEDGVSPVITVTTITGGHEVSIVDGSGTSTFDVMDGTDGVSPSVVITSITGGHRVAVTDASGTDTFDVMDGTDGQDGTDGTNAYVYVRWSATQPTQDSDMSTTPNDWMGIYSGSASTAPTSYTSYQWYKVKGETGTAENIYGSTVPMSPQDSTKVETAINGKLSAPATAGTSGQVLTSDGQGGQSWQNPSGGTITDVQVNSTSVVTSGVANIPVASNSTLGVVKTSGSIPINSNGELYIAEATSSVIKAGTSALRTITPNKQHESVFYGLAKVAGSDEKDSQESVGTYTSAAKTAIKSMLGVTDMTGATSSTAGANGLAPAPSAGDQNKVLTGGGTWEESPGAKVYTTSALTITNTSGSFSQSFSDENIGSDMQAIRLEIADPSVFNDDITITPGNGTVTVACSDVAGTTTMKISLQKVIADPTAVTSTEFTILNNRLLAVENVCTDTPISIATTDWTSVTGGYVYTWSSDLVTTPSEIEVFLRDGAENAGIEEFDYDKTTGGVQFTVSSVPTASLPVTIRVINAKADAFQSLTGEDIGTSVITGADNVDEALTALNGKLTPQAFTVTVNSSVLSKITDFGHNSYKVGDVVYISGFFKVASEIAAYSSLFDIGSSKHYRSEGQILARNGENGTSTYVYPINTVLNEPTIYANHKIPATSDWCFLTMVLILHD